MPKLKSHRGAAKRFNKKSSGSISRSRSHHRHILTKKSTKRKRHLRSVTVISEPDRSSVGRMLQGS